MLRGEEMRQGEEGEEDAHAQCGCGRRTADGWREGSDQPKLISLHFISIYYLKGPRVGGIT